MDPSGAAGRQPGAGPSDEVSEEDLNRQFQNMNMYQQYPSYPYNYQQYPAYGPQFYNAPAEFSVETMHGMPGFPGRPPVMRSNQTSPHNQPFPSPVQSQPPYWSPPMSPMQYPQRHTRHGSFADDFGPQQFYSPPTSWTSPSPYTIYTPYPPQIPTMDARPGSDWGSQGPRRSTRMSWSGPSRQFDERERKPYHPQPPAKRSDWVMWVGNVPPNTSHEELWKYFNENVPTGGEDDEAWKGPSSIFLISRSSCAFVNLSSQSDLDRAVAYFNGRPLRPWDSRCPRMVCRVRRKDDDLRAGVGAQRGTGMHREWVKAQPKPEINTEEPQSAVSAASGTSVPPSPAILEHPPEGEGRRRESIEASVTRHKSNHSHASTNSSFLARHFPKRIFILKSMTTAELEESVRTSLWKTQKHNEPILGEYLKNPLNPDQAFRTSAEVFLVFGANRAGEFYGYAKMIEPIDKKAALAKNSSSGSGSSKNKPGPIKEEDETVARPGMLLSASQPRIATSSPGELTPADEKTDEIERLRANTEPSPPKLDPDTALETAEERAQTLPSYFPPPPNAQGDADKQEKLGGSERPPEIGEDGIKRKDTALTEEEKKARESEDITWGHIFKIEWIKTTSLPFTRTRHLRNPWNADREVKVSRDGTEVEPNVGNQLLAEWDKP